MQLDLTQFRQPLSHVARVFAPDALGEDPDAYRIVAPVQLAFDIHKDGQRFRLVGRVQTGLELACSRCLEPFALPVDAAFDSRYVPADELAGTVDREVGEDDLETSIYRDDQLDLGELVREQLYLVLPMKPLCRDDCRGLCPQCGTNLNTGSCGCASAWEDPRLAPLKGLLHPTRES